MFSSLVLLALSVTSTWSLPNNRTDPLTNAPIAAGTFEDPSSNVRPRFRYWVPDASVDLDRLTRDIAEAGSAGAGGVEVLGYYLYGGENIYPGSEISGVKPVVDYDVYGFGLPDWVTLFRSAAQAHKDNGLIMDFAIGPNQGQGVPAPVDSEGLAWDLASFNVTVVPGGTFSGTIPGWGEGDLIGLTSAAVISSVSFNATVPDFFGDLLQVPKVNHTLATSSITDHTTEVDADGSITISFPANSSVIEYRLFATYLFHNEWRAAISGPDPQTWLQNGSFAVDHFSAAGAQTTTKFWEDYVLVNGTLELLKEIGNYAWEDSIEIFNNLYWTRAFPERFINDHGYSIIDYIPILLNGNNIEAIQALLYPETPTELFWTDEADGGQTHVDDYRTTLGHCYNTYISTLKTWANEYLDMQFSTQVAYNLPVDVLSSVSYVDAPELESLGFGRQIDSYRQYVGPANLADKRVISSELGAVTSEAWQQYIPELLFDVKRSVAAGVNQMVFHGLPYSGNYPNTTWPGFTTFTYLFSEMHGRHQPAWAYYADYLDYVARLQLVAQTGTPKRDLAIWQKDTFTAVTNVDYKSTDLVAAGYGYEYLSPDNFALPQAEVTGGRLASDGPAYQALLVQGNVSLTLLGAQKLVEFAHAGLPIVIQGGLPTRFVGFNQSQADEATGLVSSIATIANVHQISFEDSVATTLKSIGITPLTEIAASDTWYTYWRRDEADCIDYVYIYNDVGPDSQGTITFNSTGIPYHFDAWTGTRTAITNYTLTGDGRTSIYFDLAGNQTTLIAFSDKPIPGVPLPSNPTGPCVSGEEVIVTCTKDEHSILQAKQPVSSSTLTNWNLTITEWAPPSDLSDIDTVAIFQNHTFSLTSLEPWSSLPGMTNVSGTGLYTTQISSPPSSSSTTTTQGVVINFGKIVHTIRVRVNGVTIPQLDVTRARADISAYLDPTAGATNLIEAEVATPLFNELRPIAMQLRTSGGFPLAVSASTPAQEYGLLDEVTLEIYDLVPAVCG